MSKMIPLPEPDEMAFESWMDSNGYLNSVLARRAWNAGILHITDKLHAHAAAVTAAARDCRTCSLFYEWEEGVCAQSSRNPCTNADKYDPLPPVRLWRTT